MVVRVISAGKNVFRKVIGKSEGQNRRRGETSTSEETFQFKEDKDQHNPVTQDRITYKSLVEQ